jgi:outer membrane protein assembly factor BamB
MRFGLFLFGWLSLLATALPLCAGDWPMWRYDAGRTAASPHELPAKLELLWARQETPREPMWDDPLNQDLMPYDRQFEPVVVGQRLFLGFNDSDKVVAIDTASGKTLWSFYTNGPVRFPPVATAERVYFTSDDGHLYCVAAADGKLIWKHRGGPSDRRILGNKRIISTWPARGGPVLVGDTVYYAASIWPFMGTFIYALDAQTGSQRWLNDSSGATYIDQPHNSPAFAGVAPQGALSVCGDVLLVPGGRSIPAAFDRKTGKQLYFHLAKNNKTGGSSVFAAGDYFFAHERAGEFSVFDLAKGTKVFENRLQQPVVAFKSFYTAGAAVRALATTDLKKVPPPKKDDSKSKGKKGDDRRKGKRRAADDDDDDDDPDPDDEKKKADDEEKSKEKDKSKNGKQNGKNRDDKKKSDDKHRWKIVADASGDLIKAGRRLYAAGKKGITVLEEAEDGKSAREVAQIPVDGPVVRLVAADEKLFAVTASGKVLAFGDDPPIPPRPRDVAASASTPPGLTRRLAGEPVALDAAGQAKLILDIAGVREGYGVAYGCGDGDLAAGLVQNSQLHLTVVEPDAGITERLRRRLDALEIYGRRAAVVEAAPHTASLPPYFSSLTIVRPAAAPLLDDAGFIKDLFESLRPYGGKALFALSPPQASEIARRIAAMGLAGAKVTTYSGGLIVERAGPLPGAATWTHQYGDVANTIKSDDLCVKLPLGLLWFGGNSNMDVLPRHGHGPSPQVVGGRLFVEGMDSLSARDVYTGRVLWTVRLPNMGNYGMYYDETLKETPLSTTYNQVHIPGANARGTNFVVTEDRVYILEGRECRILDPASGATLGMFSIRTAAAGTTKFLAPNPPEPEDDAGESKSDRKRDRSKKDEKSSDKESDRDKEAKPAEKFAEKLVERNRVDDWAYLGVFDKHLIGGAGFAYFPRDNTRPVKRDARSRYRFTDYDVSASRALVGMDRLTGREKWRIEARHGFIHNAIVAGNGLLFCLDKLPPGLEQKLKRRGKKPPATSRLVAIDLATGDIRWETSQHIFGSWLGFLDERKMLLQASRPSRDMLTGEEGSRLVAYDAATGKVLWDKPHKYDSPPILHREWIIAGSKAYDQKTGELAMREDPLTGKKTPWSYSRAYGCNYPVASEHMLMFRSAAAGFFDLASDGGTGNFGGFKSSCSANLIAADGVLSAPDYTRTCSCSYQNQTSLALVHMPDVEMWTNNELTFRGGVIRRVGLNFGAAGDRRAADGTLWLEHPSKAGKSPKLDVRITGEPEYFQHAASRISAAGAGYNWVASSGLKGAVEISVTLDSKGLEALAAGIHIAASSDDAEEDAKGKMRLDSGDLELTEDATEQVVGLRYTHLEIPQGTKIDLAYIQFKADEPNKDTGDLVIQAQAADDTATFAKTDKDISKRPRTKAKVAWKVPTWDKAGETTGDQRTPSLIPLIEEVVARPGWQPDSSIAFLITGEGEHIARAYDSDPSGAPTLYVKLKGGKILTAASTVKPKKYNVELLFAEPENMAPGERVFDVLIQGKPALNGFDIAATAGPRRLVAREFRDIAVNGKLKVSLRSSGKHRPILCGLKATAVEEEPAVTGTVGGQP